MQFFFSTCYILFVDHFLASSEHCQMDESKMLASSTLCVYFMYKALEFTMLPGCM